MSTQSQGQQTGQMQGMDTEHARQVSTTMGQQAGQVAGVVAGIGQVIAGLSWQGADRTSFETDWHGSFAPQAHQASESLQEHARLLATHADRQDAASS